ncbi:hypothetical protein U1Q18_002650 [Sarracenia purpurea var. burkii]
MHHFFPKSPRKPINEIQNPTGFVQFLIQFQSRIISGIEIFEVIDEDVKIDPVGSVVGIGEGTEAARKRSDAIEGENFNGDGEFVIVAIKRGLGTGVLIEEGWGWGRVKRWE